MTMLLTRRTFLISASALSATTLTPIGYGQASAKLDHKLSLYNIHTGEFLKETYIENGQLIPEVVQKINLFMRDHRNNKVHEMDMRLMHLVNRLQVELATAARPTFDLISGYRSPETNAALRKKGRGVAKNSYHMKGCAVDICLPKRLRELRDLAKSYRLGGVGYYSRSGFVHVDVRNRPAYWGA